MNLVKTQSMKVSTNKKTGKNVMSVKKKEGWREGRQEGKKEGQTFLCLSEWLTI